MKETMKETMKHPCVISIGDMLLRLWKHQSHANLEIFTTTEADQGPQYTRILNLNLEELEYLRDQVDGFIQDFKSDEAEVTGAVEITKAARAKH